MAYQPKSYRKFVATAATATLVATAFAPFASAHSFKDVETKYDEAVDFLVSKGVSGYTDGTFKTQKTITRIEAAEMLGKALGLDKVTDAPASGFTDVPARVATLINAFKAKGITTGKTATTFDPNAQITRGELAVWIQRAYDLKAKEGSTSKFTDVADNYKAAVQALVDNGITSGTSETTFGTTASAKRGDFAFFVKKAADASVKEVALAGVTAINAKTIEVKFNKAVEDTSKATVELLRGTFKQNVTLKWAEDKKSVQLIGAGNFQAADYTVKISGLTKEALTGTVKIEAQKVASIEILDEVAVVSASNAGGTLPDSAKATVGYLVKDQYGTDITKNFSLRSNNETYIKPSNGVVTIEGNELKGKKIGDLVPVVLIDTTTGVSASKTVKLSDASAVSTIEVAGIYNAKGEAVELNDNSKASEAFIVLNLKDQYGKEITDASKASGLVITNTNPTNITLKTEKVNTVDVTKVTKKKIGDKDKLVIELDAIKKAGDTEVLLISTTNGQSAKYTVKVAETATTDAISVSQPEIAVAEETTLIPLTVADKSGNLITDKKLLANAAKGIKVGGQEVKEADLEVKDGQVYYKTEFKTSGTQALVFQSASYKVATITIDVKAAAKPTVVRGLKNPLVISTAQKTVTIKTQDHLLIEDQYGRVMTNSSAPVKVSLVGTSDVVTVAENTVVANKNGTATLKVELVTPNGTVDSAVEVKVQVTDGTEYGNYEIAEIGKVQASDVQSAGTKKITVNGILNGGKVALLPSEYTATISGGQGSKTVSNGTFDIKKENLNVNSSKNPVDTEFTLKVTINATGKVLEHKFTVSAADKVVQDFFFTSTEVTEDYASAKAITEATLKSGSTVASLEAGEKAVNVATVDQYGNKVVTAIGAPTVTIVPEKASEVTITSNGTIAATATLKDGVSESVVTLKVRIGSATKDLKVKIVK